MASVAEKRIYTAEDYWNLPDGRRAELIDGQLYDMASPGRFHQKLVGGLYAALVNYIRAKGGLCEVYLGPFAVNLNADDETYLEPDISVVCDLDKLSDRGCEGAPDFIIEVVSPSSRKMDYRTKMGLYMDAGVREYWIVDPQKERTTIYRYEEDVSPIIIPFDYPVQAGIFGDFEVRIADL